MDMNDTIRALAKAVRMGDLAAAEAELDVLGRTAIALGRADAAAVLRRVSGHELAPVAAMPLPLPGHAPGSFLGKPRAPDIAA